MTKQYRCKRALVALGCVAALTSTVWAQVAPPTANISLLNRVATNQPRTIGVDLNFKF
jgi:hypothetical protein